MPGTLVFELRMTTENGQSVCLPLDTRDRTFRHRVRTSIVEHVSRAKASEPYESI